MSITVAMRTQVSQLYVSLFGRAPDGEGLGYWVNKLAQGNSLAQVAQDMFNVDAARAYYPSFLTNDEIVAAFYVNVLGRTADAEGQAYWVGEMNKSGATKGSVITDMINAVVNYTGTDGDGVKSKALFTNKVAVAQYYGEKNGNIAGATNALAGVSDAASTVTAAKAAVDAGANPGQTFTLTAGIDNIAGTAGSDTINAYASGVTSAGANATTLGANDVINGGAGVDTLNIEVLSVAADGNALRNATIQGTISNVEKVFITNGADLAADLDVTKLGTALQEAWQVTSARGVTEVTTQAVGFKNVDAATTAAVTYGATTKSGTIALDNAGKGGLTVAIQGAVLETLNVAGSVKAASATAAGTVTLTDDADGGGAGTVGSVKTLNLNLSTAATVSVAGLDKLETIASTGAGNLSLGTTLSNVVKSVTTADGNDTFTLITATSATVNASASTGAGKDTVTVNTSGTAGTVTIDAGAGDDSIVYSRALTTRDKVNGGDGADTLTIQGTSLIAGDYEVIKASVSNVETLKFAQAMASADGSKLSQFTGFSFTTDASSITKVADAQKVTTTGDVTVTAAGYVAKGAGTPAATATTYAGSLTAEASGGTAVNGGTPQNDVVVTASASSINLTVKATAATASAAGTASFSSLTGDVQTATVNLVNSVNAATTATATADVLANFALTTAGTQNGANEFTALGALTSLTLTGNGAATVSNTTGSKLVTIDASGMTGVAAWNATKQVGGLTFTGLNTLAETVTLGGGLDSVTTVSTYDKMDTITGLTLVAQAGSTTAVDTAKSDDLTVTGTTTFVKTTVTGDTLGLAFIAAAAKTDNAVVFQYGGDTYVYVDATGAGVLDNADVAIKLTGAVDLDLLVSTLNA